MLVYSYTVHRKYSVLSYPLGIRIRGKRGRVTRIRVASMFSPVELDRDKQTVERLGRELRRLRKTGVNGEQIDSLVRQIKQVRSRRLDAFRANANLKRKKAHAAAVDGFNCCKYWLAGKGRYCKMVRKSGAQFCPAHMHGAKVNSDKGSMGRKRARTSAYAAGIKAADTALDPTRPFYCHNVNRDFAHADDASTSGTIPRSAADIRRFDNKMKKLLSSVVPSQIGSSEPPLQECLPESCRRHVQEARSLARVSTGLFEENAEVESAGASQCLPMTRLIKHSRQIASIIGNMEAAGLTVSPSQTTFVELGAGKATLSGMLSQTTSGHGGHFVLIDRGTGFRNKSDRKIRNSQLSSLERHTIDIADLVLDKIPATKNRSHCVLISKHLCGAATCLGLRSVVSMKKARQQSGEDDKKEGASESSVLGMCLATCCHHACTWNDYVNKEFFRKGGFSPSDFNAMLRMSSWGTCGFGRQKTSAHAGPGLQASEESIPDSEKIAIGQRCKMLLDVGRILYLQDAGFKCEIVRYVDGALTPENRLLVATAIP